MARHVLHVMFNSTSEHSHRPYERPGRRSQKSRWTARASAGAEPRPDWEEVGPVGTTRHGERGGGQPVGSGACIAATTFTHGDAAIFSMAAAACGSLVQGAAHRHAWPRRALASRTSCSRRLSLEVRCGRCSSSQFAMCPLRSSRLAMWDCCSAHAVRHADSGPDRSVATRAPEGHPNPTD